MRYKSRQSCEHQRAWLLLDRCTLEEFTLTRLSVLDLMMIGEGKQFADTLIDAATLARHVETHGYHRYWIAEHHDLPGIASSATSLLINYLATQTSTLRIGAGGIMLPNHSPLVIAEQFATLDALHPGRIDLGVGRAAGAAGPSIRALRGDTPEREFPADIEQLKSYLEDDGKQPVRGIPGKHKVPVWLLGSSIHSAALAARRGMPYAFASHFAPSYLMEALAHYRENFRPSADLDRPYVIAGVNVFAAKTKTDAKLHASSHFQWVNMLYTGRPGPLPPPSPGYLDQLTDSEQRILRQAMAYTAIGDRLEVRQWLQQFISMTGADELMIDARIYDTAARCESYQMAIEALQ